MNQGLIDVALRPGRIQPAELPGPLLSGRDRVLAVLLVGAVVLYNVQVRRLHRHPPLVALQEWLLWTALAVFGLLLVYAIFKFYFIFVLVTVVVGLATFVWIRFVRFPPLIARLQRPGATGTFDEPRHATSVPRPRSDLARHASAAGADPRPRGDRSASVPATGVPAGRPGASGSPIRSSGATTVPTSSELAFTRRAILPPQTSPHVSLFVVVSGGGWVQVGDERLAIHHGEAVTWPADLSHGAWTDGSEMRALLVELAEDGPAIARVVPGWVVDGRPAGSRRRARARAAGAASRLARGARSDRRGALVDVLRPRRAADQPSWVGRVSKDRAELAHHARGRAPDAMRPDQVRAEAEVPAVTDLLDDLDGRPRQEGGDGHAQELGHLARVGVELGLRLGDRETGTIRNPDTRTSIAPERPERPDAGGRGVEPDLLVRLAQRGPDRERSSGSRLPPGSATWPAWT